MSVSLSLSPSLVLGKPSGLAILSYHPPWPHRQLNSLSSQLVPPPFKLSLTLTNSANAQASSLRSPTLRFTPPPRPVLTLPSPPHAILTRFSWQKPNLYPRLTWTQSPEPPPPQALPQPDPPASLPPLGVPPRPHPLAPSQLAPPPCPDFSLPPAAHTSSAQMAFIPSGKWLARMARSMARPSQVGKFLPKNFSYLTQAWSLT